MNILVVNDDGIYAPGLWALASELKRLGKVTVVAPDREQSGIGAAITLHHPLRLQKVKSEIRGIESYAVGGTPGDSVIMAINLLANDKFDLAVSGINNGPNLGVDIFQSGTVSLPSLSLWTR
jgi:5'-nucleotidase